MRRNFSFISRLHHHYSKTTSSTTTTIPAAETHSVTKNYAPSVSPSFLSAWKNDSYRIARSAGTQQQQQQQQHRVRYLPKRTSLLPSLYLYCTIASFLLGSHLVSASAPSTFAVHPFEQSSRMFYRARANSHKGFVDSLLEHGVINSKNVEAVLRSIDRGHYTPPGIDPYEDAPQTLGYGQTISAPHMHAMCLELVEDRLKPGAHVLDVGSGSGYLTTAFGLMVGEQGKVIGIDVVEPLVAFATANIQKDHPELFSKGIVEIKLSDGWKGYPQFAPYDVIHVGAAAATMPQDLVKQLKPGGIMVIPVGKETQYLVKVEKDADGHAHETVITGVRYVPLVRKDA